MSDRPIIRKTASYYVDEIADLRQQLTAARDEIENLKSGQIKTDNAQTLVNALEEIEALKLANRDLQHWFEDARDEAERLRGRVSELEATVRLAVENAKDDDPDVWIQIDRVLAADNSRAWLVRKQAEAVEGYAVALHQWLKDRPGNPSAEFVDGIYQAAEQAERYEKRLRNQANELEAGGGE